MDFTVVLVGAGGVAAGAAGGWLMNKVISSKSLAESKTLAERILEEARKEAQAHKKEIILQTQDELYKQKLEHEREVKERESQLVRKESSLQEKLDKL